jgi:hypothetical protein
LTRLDWQLVYIPREENVQADKLAKAAKKLAAERGIK